MFAAHDPHAIAGGGAPRGDQRPQKRYEVAERRGRDGRNTDAKGDRSKARGKRRGGRRKTDYFKEHPEATPHDYLNLELLKRFIAETGKILPRRRTGLAATTQRQVARSIKRARMLGLLPFADKLVRDGSQPERRGRRERRDRDGGPRAPRTAEQDGAAQPESKEPSAAAVAPAAEESKVN